MTVGMTNIARIEIPSDEPAYLTVVRLRILLDLA